MEHLSKHISEQVGFEISKQTLSNHLIKVAKMVKPIYEKMKKDLISCHSKVLHVDETTLSILKHSEENKDRKKSYVYVLASSMYDSQQIRIYDFHESRSIEPVGKWIKDFDGVITCDGFDGYDKLISFILI
jgi:Transposase IS66 family.